MATNSTNLTEALRSLLLMRKATTQEDICLELERQGFEINQSKASRLLRKIGAIKVINSSGETVYSLPREPSPPNMQTSLRELIFDISHNESLVIVLTSPGSASMVARILDYHDANGLILGTIAGDDTIFIAPRSVKQISKLAKEIKVIFQK